MRQSHKTLALWVLLILMFWAIYQIISQEHAPQEQPEFSKLLKSIDDGNVKEVTVTLLNQGSNAGTFEGKYSDDESEPESPPARMSCNRHVVSPPRNEYLVNRLVWVPPTPFPG